VDERSHQRIQEAEAGENNADCIDCDRPCKILPNDLTGMSRDPDRIPMLALCCAFFGVGVDRAKQNCSRPAQANQQVAQQTAIIGRGWTLLFSIPCHISHPHPHGFFYEEADCKKAAAAWSKGPQHTTRYTTCDPAESGDGGAWNAR
jgi:hypothetical protein